LLILAISRCDFSVGRRARGEREAAIGYSLFLAHHVRLIGVPIK
jgi:hypothetical protein